MVGFVKRNLSEAQRRKDAASGERGAGKGAQPLSAPQHRVARSAHSTPYRNFQWTESSLFTPTASSLQRHARSRQSDLPTDRSTRAAVTFPCVE